MVTDARTEALGLLRRLFQEGVVSSPTDGQLVERFTTTRDPEAFASIVGRYGPTVLSACRGMLGPGGDADDAFQATFLILLDRIGTFSVGESLGGWLYRVARRVARQARRSQVRRRNRESRVAVGEGARAAAELEREEIQGVIREEIDRLPERYRITITLCDLQGLTRDEASERLGCPAGTVGGRLFRARRRLRDRLERRGVAPSIVFPLPAITTEAWRASLRNATRAATSLAEGRPPTPAVASLATRATRAVTAVPAKMTVAAAVAACFTIGLFAAGRAIEPPSFPVPQAPSASKSPEKAAASPDPDDPKLAGHFAGRVIGPDDKPLAGARIYIMANRATAKAPGPVRATSGADGRFQFDAPDMTYTGLDGLPERRPGVLIASADGLAPDSVVTWGQTGASFHSHYDPVKGADITLKLVRDDVPIRGRVLDPEGRPIAGARVRLTGITVPSYQTFDAYLEKYKLSANEVWSFDYRSIYLLPEFVREIATDSDGRFLISGVGRDRLASLSITAPGAVVAVLTVMTRDAPDIVLGPDRGTLGANFAYRLKPGLTARGVVRDRDTHEPISGVKVGSRNMDWIAAMTGIEPSVSDDQGRFSIAHIDPRYLPLDIKAIPRSGGRYFGAKAVFDGKSDLVIECSRGIPFRLTLVDESGKPVKAEVESEAVSPNPNFAALLQQGLWDQGEPIGRAARGADGTYEGVVLPGPGALMVKTPKIPDFRPAYVDPKAFFAPGKSDWTDQERYTAFGTLDNLSIGVVWADQHDYAAIVLVNPPVGSKPLELSATVFRDKPRMVTLLDPEGRPVVGADTAGMTPHPYDTEPRLRAATFPLKKLNPERNRRIRFFHADRRLIGFLMARGDAETPYTVRLQPWATLTGRIVGEDGKPLSASGPAGKQEMPASLGMGAKLTQAVRDDPTLGDFRDMQTDGDGRFRVEQLVPGQRYTAEIYRNWRHVGIGFKDLILKPGEVRDLGDIRIQPPTPQKD